MINVQVASVETAGGREVVITSTTIYTGSGSHSVKNPNIYPLFPSFLLKNIALVSVSESVDLPETGVVISAAPAFLTYVPNITPKRPWPLTPSSKFSACSGTLAPHSRGTIAMPLIAYPHLCKEVRGIAIGASYKFVSLTSGLEEDKCQGI